MPKKILYLVSTLKKGGPNTQLYNIIKYLDSKLFKPYVVTLSPETNNSLWEKYEKLGVEINSLNLTRIKGIFLAKRYLKKHIEIINPDIIHSQGIRADTFISNLNVSKPWVITSRNYPFIDYPMKFGRFKGNIMARKHISAMKNCNNVVSCSITNSQLLQSHNVKTVSIQNGVDPKIGNFKNILTSHNFSRPIFITVGAIIPLKNVKLIIQAFKSYLKYNNGSLIILGDGLQLKELKNYAGNQTFFFGRVNNVEDYLALSDYYVSASLSEGLPNSVLEALAAGLPTILSDIDPHIEIAKECTGSALIFSLKEGLGGLANAMERASDIFSNDSKVDAQRVAQEVFSAKVMSNKYQEIYLESAKTSL